MVLGIRELSLISKDGLFLCDSGDEIRSLNDKCNIKQECDDASDERNCDNCKCLISYEYGEATNAVILLAPSVGKRVRQVKWFVRPRNGASF